MKKAGTNFSVLPMVEPEPRLVDDLGYEWARAFLTELKQRYDVVILDSPPILSVPDAFMFAEAVNSCLYLVRWLRTPPSAVRQGLTSLAEMRGPRPDLVLTMVDPDKLSAAYYGGAYEA